MAPRVALLPDDPTTNIMMVTFAAIFFDTLCLPGQLCFLPLDPRHVCPPERCTGYFSVSAFFSVALFGVLSFPLSATRLNPSRAVASLRPHGSPPNAIAVPHLHIAAGFSHRILLFPPFMQKPSISQGDPQCPLPVASLAHRPL